MEQKTKELNLGDFIILNDEINGIKNETQVKIKKGLTDENLTFSGRYWLNDLNKLVTDEIKAIDVVRNSLIHKYGEQEGEQILIKNEIIDIDGNQIVNPKLIQFFTEWQNFLSTKKTIEYYPLPIDGFRNVESNTETSVEYKMILSFIEKE